jgi:UDP:flavonoid glycosyltransferase YjiC (YdhE family)
MSTASTMTLHRFLFVTWEGGGNVAPILGLARRLVERGHSVRVISDPCNKEEVKAAGCEFTAYSQAPHRSDKSVGSTLAKDYEGSPVAGLRSFVKTFWSPGFAQDVLEELSTRPVDVCCVNDILISALFAPEKAGIRTVLLMPNCNTLLPGPGVGLGGKAKVAFQSFVFQRIIFSRAMATLRDTRKALGLPPLQSLYAYIYHLSKVLIMTSRAFDSKAEVAPNYQYIGPILDDPTWTEAWQSPWSSDSPDPLVVVSLSTTYQHQEEVMQKVLDALDGLNVRVLVTLGPTLDQTQFRIPANVVVRQSVPHAQVFPLASVVVSHGGHGTVTRALVSGVPLVCIPFGRDQPNNAAYVVAKGAGLKLGKKASVASIREVIQRVVKEPAFRENARKLGKTLAEDACSSTGVQMLEQVAATVKRG